MGNQMACLAQADATYKTLHYKDERQFPFIRFLHSAQQMFDDYTDASRPFTDGMRVDFLFNKVATCPHLTSQIQSLQIDRNQGKLRYDDVCCLFKTLIAQKQSKFHSTPHISDVATSSPERWERRSRPRILVSQYKLSEAEVDKKYMDDEWRQLNLYFKHEVLQCCGDKRESTKSTLRRLDEVTTTHSEAIDDLSTANIERAYHTISQL
jgi:hypothetical protein